MLCNSPPNEIFLILCLGVFSHDLDNILLENLGDARTLQAVFELEALVLTGIGCQTLNKINILNVVWFY